ncbi:hypothetical protein Q0Z83_064590 [Actinoplanes sichuanensis]|uniref:Non-ribosomal peptide synthetase n=1 Tax=Actinoplanes sichuanensis TaxID=512349 RepID=A0ABW4ALS5_9ACTN|nr:non-ribosomal peptide synthetase [Actinoplanes sichuanensis]BEL08268.1 hypothetical protein Q0Z83_064590 [Actinoplanes sichuanensis]
MRQRELSPVEAALWTECQSAAGAEAYTIPYVLRLRGAVDVQALRAALRLVVARHETLRTGYGWHDGRPVATVHDDVDVPFTVVDLTGADHPDGELDERIRAASSGGFDFAHPPLLRATLLLVDDGAVFCLYVHHLITDGRSREVLFADLLTAYGTGAAPAGEPGTGYTEWSAGQLRALADGDLDEHRDVWRRRLAVAQTAPDRLVTGAGSRTYQGSRVTRELTGDDLAKVRRLAATRRTTVGAVLAAAWSVALAGFGDGRNAGFAMASANRPVRHIDVVGSFAAVVPVAVEIDPEAEFGAVLAEVTGTLRDAMSRPALPVHLLADAGRPRRGFDTMFVHTVVPDEIRLPGLTITPMAGGGQTAKCALLLSVTEAPERIELLVEYATDRVTGQTAESLIGTVHAVLTGATAQTRVVDLAPRPAESWSRGAAVGVVGVLPAIRDRVGHTPDETAVVAGDVRLSYAELWRRSGVVAARLAAEGVRRGSFVGVSLDRSADLVPVLLGIMRAGAAYVPLPPWYPADRLAFMVADAGVEVVVGSFDGDVTVLPADTPRESGAGTFDDVPLSLGDPAYVIYTSGSTGRPKGVVVTHANLGWLLESTRPAVGTRPGDVWSVFHSYAFDFSVFEIWCALASGGTAVVVDGDTVRSPRAFGRLLADEGVTVLSQTPSAFKQLVGELPADSRVRVVVFGGERLDLAAVRGWREDPVVAGLSLVNMYGITETTVHVTEHEVGAGEPTGSPVGFGLPGTDVRVLDAYLRPVPAGVVGEIYVGGQGVALGYWGRPDLTAQRFVPDPFASVPGARMYRSGDLARVHADGGLEYVGRADFQVKVRGHRIELGEIEHAIAAYPGVRSGVVSALRQSDDSVRLVAHVVPADGVELSVGPLREFLAAGLADYMIPAVFVFLPELPLTVNGKVDRTALPAPDDERPELSTAYTAPSNDLERSLAEVWAQVLRVQRVGVHDNFFELGGDSILAVQIIGELSRFGLTVTLDALFRTPTIAALAETLTAAVPPGALPAPFELLTDQERAMVPPDVEDAYPMTATQLGMYLQNRLHANSRIYHNLNSLDVTGRVDPDAFTAAVEAAVQRIPALRTGFAVDGLLRPLQLVYRTAPADVTCVDLLGLTEAEQETAIEKVIAAELDDAFEPGRPPQIRFRLLRRAADRFQLLVVESHLIVDGWSFTSLLAEIFEDHWSVVDTGAPLDRPPLRSSFAEFVKLEQAAITSAESRAFWARQVADAPPTRIADLAERDGELTIARRSVDIPAEVEQGLRDLAGRLGVPLKSVLMAAHLRVLAGLLGSREVVSGMVTHGRPEGPDGDRIKGLFLNTVPFRLALGDGSWSDIVRHAHRAEVDLLPHRRYPLGRILRDLHRSELFDASFHFVTFHELKRVFHDGSPWDIRPDTRSSENTHFRLMAAFSVHPPADRLALVLVHDQVTLGRHIDMLADAYARALATLATDADRPHASFSLLDRAESWSAGDRVEVTDVVSAVRDSVHRAPDGIAVVAGADRISYAELWRRSGVVAARLAAEGVRRGSFVGVSLDRSADLVPVLLGIMRAGAAYVPLPPWYPADRLAFMVADAGVEVVVGSFDGDATVLPADTLRDAEAPPFTELTVTPDDAAYMIYTSGSTGRPKGVLVTHGNVGWLLSATRPVVRPTPDDVFSVFHSYAFDVSVYEIWAALGAGATAVVVDNDTARSPRAFGRLLADEGVTVLSQTPSAFKQLVGEIPGDAKVRVVVFGGERLDFAAVRSWRADPVVAGLSLINLYGITETTVHVTAHEVGADEPVESPVGYGMAGTDVWVLDAFLRPTPVGVVGEIYVGGQGVTLGYWGRPDLTAQRFVPDPFAPEPGARMYRSGDLARVRPDGGLEYVGRADFQVKVRGHRIELGEIEHAIAAYPGVRSCVVVAQRQADNSVRLIAYVVPADGAEPAVGPLRDFLAVGLADYMIPAAFVFLPELPLTVNGKVDRAALPAPDDERPELSTLFEAPSNDLERSLAEVWADVLRVQRVGVHDNFFELGGDSILAVQIAAEIQMRTGRPVELVDIYQAPSVRELAEHLAAVDEYAAAEVQA